MGLAFPHGVPRWRSRGRDALSPSFLYQPDQGPAKGSRRLRDTLRTRLLCICARRLGLSPLPSRCRGRASGMKLGATCLLCLLLTCMAPPAAGRLRVHSMEIRSKESRSKGTPRTLPGPPIGSSGVALQQPGRQSRALLSPLGPFLSSPRAVPPCTGCFSSLSLQTQTSTPSGTPAVASGPWGDSGDGEHLGKAPNPGGLSCILPASPRTPSPPGSSKVPELKMGDANKSLFSSPPAWP